MSERAQFLAEQREDMQAAVAQLEEVIAGLDEHIERSFNEVFQAAKENFEAVISVVFPGAKGSLKLTEERPGLKPASEEGGGIVDDLPEEVEAPAARGVTLEVKFANKAPRTLSLLSGGEKAMTAIAFLFSLFLARPCPFYILDEVEASLDDPNIRRFLSLVHKYRDRTQFIIITHQRQTMEVADTLYGVALEADGTSRLLSRKMTMAKGA
jgi:chromosome segregation protein